MVMPRSLTAFMVLVICLCGGMARGQFNFHWRGDPDADDGNGTFAIADHWTEVNDQPGPPTAGDYALFNYSGTYTVTMGGQHTKWTELGGGYVTFDGQYSTGVALLGQNGGGVLNLSSGSSLTVTESTTASLIVGTSTGGQLLLDGTGTKVVVSQGGVIVGNGGVTGWLSLKGGATAEFSGPTDTFASTVFGVGGGSSGTGVVEGEGSMMDIKRGGLEIGRGGTGRVDVISGGKIQVDKAPDVASILLGTESGGDGTLVVSGQGSDVTMSLGGLEVGRLGTGRVDVIGGAKMTFTGNQLTSAVLGSQFGANGTVVVSGGSEMRATGGFTVGRGGTANVFLSSGGLLQIDKGSTQMGLLLLGTDTTGNGYVSISGSGTRCEVDRAVVVGQAKTGRLDAGDGGELKVHGVAGSPALTVGSSGGSVGDMYLTGAGSHVSLLQGQAVIGDGGKGLVSVAAFTSLTMNGFGDDLIVGNAMGGDGTLDIGSPAAAVTTLGDLVVGRGGKGKVSLSGGNSIMTSFGGEIGVGGEGEIDVNQSPWYSQTSIVVGGTSKGTLLIGAGGAAYAPISVTIGKEASSDGLVFLADNGSLNTSLLFFGKGKGSLYLTANSGFQTSYPLVMGLHAGAEHTILVDGAGSQFTADSDVILGLTSGGKGNLFTTNSGQATITRNLAVGSEGQGSCVVTSGSYLIVGQATHVVRGILTVDGASGYGSKTLGILNGGVVVLTNGAACAISKELLIGPGGGIEVIGSSRVGIGSIAAEQLSANAITVGPGGRVISSGAIMADVFNKGGTVKLLNATIPPPSGLSEVSQGAAPSAPGIQGSYEQTADGVLHVIITGTTAGEQYAQLIATSANIAGKIILEFQQGFAPANGQVFDLVQSPSTTIDPSVTVEMRNLAPGFQYNLGVVDGNYRLTAQSDAVPAPVYACTLDHVPGLYLQVDYTGILQSSTDLRTWSDVPGGPGYSFQVPEKDIVGQKFFRVRSF
jgi:T5SS/PEP-CTERM-associated repeat protein